MQEEIKTKIFQGDYSKRKDGIQIKKNLKLNFKKLILKVERKIRNFISRSRNSDKSGDTVLMKKVSQINQKLDGGITSIIADKREANRRI